MQPDLKSLLQLTDELPAYHRLVKEIEKGNSLDISVLDAARAFVIAALYHHYRRPVLVVTGQPEDARRLQEQIAAWCGPDSASLFPEPDALPYERLASGNSAEVERLRVLAALASGCTNGSKSVTPPLVVASALAFMQKTAPHDRFAAACREVRAGMEIDPLRLLEEWQSLGYSVENMVEEPGTMSRRGGVVDVYPPTSDLPARIEFFGNTVESIRLFDPTNQRSQRKVPAITITPATELLPLVPAGANLSATISGIDLTGLNDEARHRFEEELALLQGNEKPESLRFYAPYFQEDSILDYLPADAIFILDRPEGVRWALEDLDGKARELRDEKVEAGELPSGFPTPYLTWDELLPAIQERQHLSLLAWTDDDNNGTLDFTSAPSYVGQLAGFPGKVKEILAGKRRLIVVSHQAGRLSELLEEDGLIAPVLAGVKETPASGSLTLVQGLLGGGWAMGQGTLLLTDVELFGFIKQQRVARKRAVSRQRFYTDIAQGDYVVHADHGIARFVGITTMAAPGGQREYLVLEYASNDRLYVPTDQIDRVTRYIGSSEQVPTLSRLGTQEWSKVKERVKESVAEIAEDLLALYAAREVVPGYAFSRDTVWQQELEASFPYVETPDQLEVLKQVKEDMEKTRPMDRLICGDVGYGKTEIAIRAAFKAVMGGKQVAVLVPTTILAEQHLATFRERVNAFPVKVEALSRFRSAKEQQAILDGLADGSVDICIGTHRLLQKDVIFKDLGLLVIDEEQRFGVAHKEHLKKMRREVDVLTLSATPIPRTLHMSLVGVRDMSLIETPPEERLPVKTYVSEYNDRLVRDAILRELERNGQVFFVHNRVQSIKYIAGKLRELVPEARISIGHGQMPEEELESVMAGFMKGDSDILVCTTIIESGLDMPNVNTMIVNQADRFGLTQLYQLRGRIGRGAHMAYAYFLYDRDKRLTPLAEKRLQTIFEATELGAGYGIAMKDLEIRGAGTLLGMKQSGHIAAVGFNLYSEMLAQAVEEQKAKTAAAAGKPAPPARLPAPTVDIPLPAFITEEYVADTPARLALYQKLVKATRTRHVESMERELSDRFGPLPTEVENLLYIVRLKLLAARAGIESITTEDGDIVVRLFEGMRFDHRLQRFTSAGVKIGNRQLTLNRRRLGQRWQTVLEDVVHAMGQGTA